MRFSIIAASAALVAGASASYGYGNSSIVGTATPPAYTPAPYVNSTVAAYPTATGTGATATTSSPAFTGAANKAFAASGAGLAAVFGIAAYVL